MLLVALDFAFFCEGAPIDCAYICIGIASSIIMSPSSSYIAMAALCICISLLYGALYFFILIYYIYGGLRFIIICC